MSIDAYFLNVINDAKKLIDSNGLKIKTAMFAYQDLLIDDKLLLGMYPELMQDQLVYRDDAKSILGWHPKFFTENLTNIVDTDPLLKVLGFETDYFDLVNARGYEKILDLNYPVEEALCQQYDLVIDSCITEKCFNISQALINTYSLLRPGGVAIHRVSYGQSNVSFYNPNPTLFYDFYPPPSFSSDIDIFLLEYSPGIQRRGPIGTAVHNTPRISLR